MTAKTLTAPVPGLIEAPPLVRALRKILPRLMGRLGSAVKVERMLAVEERVALGPKKSLVLVRCHGQRFLVPVSGETIGPLTELAKSKAPRRNPTAPARRSWQEYEA